MRWIQQVHSYLPVKVDRWSLVSEKNGQESTLVSFFSSSFIFNELLQAPLHFYLHRIEIIVIMMKNPCPYTILWSTQSGKAKACARRTARILRSCSKTPNQIEPGYHGCSFDDYTPSSFANTKGLVIMFISTTGDGEHTDTISKTWNFLKSKSLSNEMLSGMEFALFCLGDRAYGPTAFCAAGRKFAARIIQLGASVICDVGYGDEGTSNGGVFSDMDQWLDGVLLPRLCTKGIIEKKIESPSAKIDANVSLGESPFSFQTVAEKQITNDDWKGMMQHSLGAFYASLCPATSYHYATNKPLHSKGYTSYRILHSEDMDKDSDPRCGVPLIGTVKMNTRITAQEWNQDTRHICLQVKPKQTFGQRRNVSSENTEAPVSAPPLASLPYLPGDIATIIPSNPKKIVDKFISCLPPSLRSLENTKLEITLSQMSTGQFKTSYTAWPQYSSLRDILTFCADICNLPEREDLRTLSAFCNPNHSSGLDQRNKLISLSEPSNAALYGDYILREKRNWADVLFDFDSIQYEGNHQLAIGEEKTYVPLTLEYLLMILSPIMPRHFSIASAPSEEHATKTDDSFAVDLCVAVVQGKTRYGRDYSGLCSSYLSNLEISDNVHLWIRPGSFSKLPLELDDHFQFLTRVLCVGAGTGVAPLRGILRERHFVRKDAMHRSGIDLKDYNELVPDNILIFGCRKETCDFYYKEEWNKLQEANSLDLLPAFSQDYKYKVYVQKIVREADGGTFISEHILNGGAIYIAGGAKMARAVREEILQCLSNVVENGGKGAKTILQKMQKNGLFAVEAWS